MRLSVLEHPHSPSPPVALRYFCQPAPDWLLSERSEMVQDSPTNRTFLPFWGAELNPSRYFYSKIHDSGILLRSDPSCLTRGILVLKPFDSSIESSDSKILRDFVFLISMMEVDDDKMNAEMIAFDSNSEDSTDENDDGNEEPSEVLVAVPHIGDGFLTGRGGSVERQLVFNSHLLCKDFRGATPVYTAAYFKLFLKLPIALLNKILNKLVRNDN